MNTIQDAFGRFYLGFEPDKHSVTVNGQIPQVAYDYSAVGGELLNKDAPDTFYEATDY